MRSNRWSSVHHHKALISLLEKAGKMKAEGNVVMRIPQSVAKTGA